MKFAMRKQFLTVLLALAATGVIMAQENGNRDEQNKIVRGPYETTRIFDNVFIGIGGGFNFFEGENDRYGNNVESGHRFSGSNEIAKNGFKSVAIDVNVGKWFTPSVGIRLGWSGLKANGYARQGDIYAYSPDSKQGFYNEKFNISHLHGDLLWNFSNTVSGYKETRTWDFVPFVGAGWVRSHTKRDVPVDAHRNELAVSVGLLNVIRLCDLLDLTLEVRQLFMSDRVDGVASDFPVDGMTSATLGLSFNVSAKRNFKRASAPVDVTQYIDRINALEKDNADVAARNKNLTDENEVLRNRKPEVVTVEGESTVAVTPVALFFKIGKATLDEKELANLDFFVNEALKLDENKVFTLYGGADKATGTSEINQTLSEKRAQYIFDILVNKYGIPKDRLKMVAEGDRNNRFPEPELNRIVLILE